ncbi:pseudaminic acid cytidylyltransferase [Flavobacterium croceum]|uniref:pseudaminic acid cytidylyltransferase n=1 Tax=Flavobacterium croceum TaxID=370975 RepID=UPI0024A9BE89|nr:pseudaminic acid cytidylyltransferase [Flavobacterium croceum]
MEEVNVFLKKNIRDFLGKPIISYSIEAAIKSNLFDEIMVSTDDQEIAEIALKYGAKVPFFRSEENSDDFAPTASVLLEVLNEYKSQGILFESAICIYPCSPFVTVELLENANVILKSQKADCVFPVIKYGHPIQRALKLNENGRMEVFFNECSNTRTQDLEKTFHDAGMFYFFNVNKFLSTRSLRTDNTFAVKIDPFMTQDIDNEVDWKLAEMKYKLMKSNR